MKKFVLLLLLVCTIGTGQAQEAVQVLKARLSASSRIQSFQFVNNTTGFQEKYVLKFNQPLDHRNPEKGSFTQRVIVMHRGFDRPTLLVTEGYSANYAVTPGYTEELSRLYNTNVIFVEHRYFSESTPTPCNWDYMTDENAMADLHEVVSAFKTTYPKKWISTGISKGGQTCMEFRALYPQDIDVSVPYVGPLCYAVEDGRHEPFLRQNGSAEDRQRIMNFQMEVLRRKQKLLPAFEAYCFKKNLRFNVPARDIFDYCVLEYSFAHWQWGTPTEQIPESNVSDEILLKELLKISGPEYFEPNKNFTPFFYQAAYELGYYGYDMKPFKKLMSIKSTRNYLRRIMLPDSLSNTKFHKKLSRQIRSYLKKNDPQMLFIYGQIDPWTAAGVTWLKGKKNMRVFVQPNGSHTARINNMPKEMRKEILDILSAWLDEQPSN